MITLFTLTKFAGDGLQNRDFQDSGHQLSDCHVGGYCFEDLFGGNKVQNVALL
jgi:hypothetical protein